MRLKTLQRTYYVPCVEIFLMSILNVEELEPNITISLWNIPDDYTHLCLNIF